MVRRWRVRSVALAAIVVSLSAVPRSQAPTTASVAGLTLRQHPDNPHYFLFRGKPTVVITSGEHYGAVLNLDFDYQRYFATLAEDHLNGTRVFSGTYVETGGNFDIASNTLDPAAGRYISPWARGTAPGYADGGAKFDLTRFDDAYVARLRDVLKEASARGIIVELVLFCPLYEGPLYEDSMWAVSPMNPANNVSGFPAIRREDVLTLDKSGPLLAVQEAVARHLVEAIAGFDNVYLEICNEPYATKVPDDWQRHMTSVVAEAVAKLPQPVLLSHNIANQGALVVDPHAAVSIFNFHYATPPDTIARNWSLRKPIGDNETGFRGTGDAAYRTEGWDFILAGGALYNNLDYSFTAGHEDGTFAFPATQPGGGGAALRNQLGYLRRFVDAFDLAKVRPEPARVVGGVPPGGSAQVLAEGGRLYGVYLRRQAAAGTFSARWTGLLRAPADGAYQLHVTSNDGVRVKSGQRTLFEDWTDHATKTGTVPIALAKGRALPIAVEYFYAGGSGVMRLAWTRPDGVRETIPIEAWTTAPDGVPGVRASYFHGTDLKQLWFNRPEPRIDHDFGSSGPRRSASPPTFAPPGSLAITLPAATWGVTWTNPVTGAPIQAYTVRHGGGVAHLTMPPWEDDVAVAIRRSEPAAPAAAR
jgi:hypothetical protein